MDGYSAALRLLEIKHTALHMDSTQFNVTRPQDGEIASWLNTSRTLSTSSLRLLIGDSRGGEGQSVSLLNEGNQFRRIPFTNETFKHISEAMELPDDFVQVLQEETSCSARCLHGLADSRIFSNCYNIYASDRGDGWPCARAD